MEPWSIGLRSCLQSISYYVLVMRVLECKTTGVAVCGSSASFEPLAGPFVAVSVQRAASCACSSAWHWFVISSGSVEQKALLYQEACRRESPPMFLTDVCSRMDFFLMSFFKTLDLPFDSGPSIVSSCIVWMLVAVLWRWGLDWQVLAVSTFSQLIHKSPADH